MGKALVARRVPHLASGARRWSWEPHGATTAASAHLDVHFVPILQFPPHRLRGGRHCLVVRLRVQRRAASGNVVQERGLSGPGPRERGANRVGSAPATGPRAGKAGAEERSGRWPPPRTAAPRSYRGSPRSTIDRAGPPAVEASLPIQRDAAAAAVGRAEPAGVGKFSLGVPPHSPTCPPSASLLCKPLKAGGGIAQARQGPRRLPLCHGAQHGRCAEPQPC